MFKCPVKLANSQRDHWCYIQCLLFILLLFRNGTFADKNKHYHISTLCEFDGYKQIYRKIDGAVLTSEGESNVKCNVTFQAIKLFHRLMLRFEELTLSCQDDLYIFDGAHSLGSLKNLSCGNGDAGVIFTKRDSVTIKYITQEWTQPRNGFKLIITAFYASSFDCRDFQCLNGFCIPKDLTCDGVDHCGDNSDETSHASCSGTSWATTMVIIGIVASSITACGIAGVGVYLYRRTRLQRQRGVFQSQNTHTHPSAAEQERHPTADQHEGNPQPDLGERCSPGRDITSFPATSGRNEKNPVPYLGEKFAPRTGITSLPEASGPHEGNLPPYFGRGCSPRTDITSFSAASERHEENPQPDLGERCSPGTDITYSQARSYQGSGRAPPAFPVRGAPVSPVRAAPASPVRALPKRAPPKLHS